MEKAKSEKMLNKKSDRHQEAQITTFTVILSAIVLNILWWTGVRFISTDSTDNVTINTSVSSGHYAIGASK